MNAFRVLQQRLYLHPFLHRRGLASFTSTPPLSPFEVFDRKTKQIQKDRAASRDGGERSRIVDYLRTEVADRMFERFMVGFLSHVGPSRLFISIEGHSPES